MERPYHKIIIFILFICLSSLKANYKVDIYNSFISNNMSNWKFIIDKMQLSKLNNTTDLIELTSYQYGYIAFCLGINDNTQAEKYLNLAEKNLEVLEKMNYQPTILNAYKSAFIGYRIGLKPWKAPYLGAKSMDCAQLAVQQDATNYMAYMQLGNIEYYKPPVFGGSKTKALSHFLIVKSLMEKNKENIDKNWIYLNLLTLIANIYSEINNNKQAEFYYQRILKLEPNFLWVKEKLYPEFTKKISTNI